MSDGSSGGSSSGSESSASEDNTANEQHVHQVVTGANADPQVLQYFWDLASLEQAERQAAAEALVAALVDSQKQYDATHRAKGDTPGGTLEQQEGGGNRQQRMEECLSCCSPLMAYGLKRLARGLASSRQGARQGFAAALAATLAHSAATSSSTAAGKQLQRPFVSAAGVLALLDACLEVTGSMKGTDQRDALLGRVFGLAALTRSGLITAVPAGAAAADGPSPSAVAAVAAVAEQLSGLLQRKSFLRESAGAGLVELLQALAQQQLSAVLAQAPRTASLLQANPAQATPESLYLVLRLWHALPAQQLEQCALLPKLSHGASPPPQAFWAAPSSVKRKSVGGAAAAVFAADHVQLMAPALLLSTASSPRLHPVWGCLLALLVPGFVPVKGQEQADDKKQQKRSPPDPQQLQALWQNFVEGSCLSSSHERKALALQLLQLLLPVMGPDMVPVLLSKQVLSCMATALKDKESYLHASAKRCLDRLSTAADHNEVVKGDAAAAARLRLALAAALQSANLAAPSGTKAAKAAKLGPLQGLDAVGVAAYVEQMLQELVKAAQAGGGQHNSKGGAAANGAAGGSSDDEEGAEDDAADDSKVLQQLEQLVAGLKLPAAETATLRKGLSFLAALAWLQLPAGFDAATAAAAAGGSSSSKKAGKKHKHKQHACGVLQHAEVQAGLQLAASISQPSDVLRHTAAARLVGLLHHVHSRAGALAAAAAHQQGKQQSNKKQQQKAGQDGGSEAVAARAAAANAADTITVELLELHAAAQKRSSVAVTADEDIAEMVEQLGQLSAAVDQHAPTTLPPTSAAASAAASNNNQHQQHQQQQQAARKRVVLHLVHQLQLQLLSGGLSAEAAGSVVDDLEVSVLKGLGLSGQLLDQLRAADAAAKLKMAGVAVDEGDDDAAGRANRSSKQPNGAAAKGSSSGDDEDAQDESDDDDDDDGSAWQDVLLDLLLSLLSNSSSGSEGSGGSGSGGVSVPSVPLREACEAVFKAFAEEMSAQGIADLLRVLSQRASEVLKPTDEEDDEDEDDGEGEEEVEQGSGSESGDEASSDLDEEQQEQLKDLHKKTAAGKTAAASSGRSSGSSSSSSGSESSSDSEEADNSPSAAGAAANGTAGKAKKAGSTSDDDEGDESGGSEGADDEAMLRMDKALGAAVRASLNRSGGSAKDRAAALLALQLRVAALLEDWLKKCSRSPIVLSVVLPLLKALVAARGAGGNPVLADRLAGLITKHLARARPAFPAMSGAAAGGGGGGKDAAAAAAAAAASDDEDEGSDGEAAAAAGAGVSDWVRSPVSALEADARKVLYYASRDKDPRVAAAASQSLLVLISAGSEAAAAAASGVAQATAAAALQDYLQHKKSRLQHNWCQQGLLARCFDAVVGGEGAALQVLLTACSKGRNEAMRCKAVQLLPSLVTGRQQAQVESLLGVLKQQQGLLAAALGAGVVGPFKNKDQHAACVKAVVVLLSGVLKQGGGKRLAELVGSEAVRELGKSVVVVKAAGVPPKVEGQLDRLVAAAGLQQLVAAGKPDPARLALLTKARAALESGGQGGAAGGKDTVQGKDARGQQQQQQSQKQKGGGKQQQQQQKEKEKKKRKAEDDEQQPAAAAAKQKKHKAAGQDDADKKKKRAGDAGGDAGVGAGAASKKQKHKQ